MLSTSNLAGQQSKATYDIADNVKSYVQPGRDSANEDNEYWSYYGSTDGDKKKHLPWRTRTPMHMTDYFSYDSYGNQTSARRVNYATFSSGAAENANPYIRTENTYTSDGNYTATTKDARGNVVTQSVNAKDGTLTSVTDPENQTVNYTYDASKRVTAVQTTGDGKTYRNGYTYENDRIKTVSHNTTSDTANDVTYTFDYDALGRKTTVKVGSQVLSTNVYEDDRNGLLSEVQYSNGGKVKYVYDDFDRLTGVKYDAEATPRYEYRYGANGQVAEVEDHNLNRTARTDYDQANRPCQTELRDNTTGEALYKTSLKYDKYNNLVQFAEKAGGESHTSDYSYDRDNRMTEIAFDGSADDKVTYAYDELGRVKSRTVKNLTSTYTYETGGYGTNSTTPLVKKIDQVGIPFEYAYDTRGNIISEKRGTLTTTYQYDALGQLIRVNDPHENATWVYNYDRGGNITSKVKYAYTTGTLGATQQTIPYTYGDSNWKDKLTNYNSQTISYDGIGNPLNDGTWNYAWSVGRQLRQMSKIGMTVQFQYDHNGLRTSKIVNGIPTQYTIHENRLTHMKQTVNDLHFLYEAPNRPSFVRYNGELYSYVLNLQGDIIGILDSAGSLVVEYKYDAWGNKLSIEGSLATTLGILNPFRYRAYIYDEEFDLYYVRGRFYNAKWNRFLNAEDGINTAEAIIAHNAFAYCMNNPVMRTDVDGAWGDWFTAITSVVTAVVVAAVVISAAPVVAAAAATTAVCLGAASAAGTVATIATAGCATVAAATIACGVNRSVEAVTGTNYGAVLLGDRGYSAVETITTMSASAISMAPSYLPYPSTSRGSASTSLRQQLALKGAMMSPQSGKQLNGVPMTDPRMPWWLGWRKYYISYPPLDGYYGKESGFQIHYVRNAWTGTSFDFKIK